MYPDDRNPNQPYGNPYPPNYNPNQPYGNPYPPNYNPNQPYGNPYPPNYYQNQPYQNPAPVNRQKKEPGNGFAITSMILGLLSLVLFCTGINIITGILAIVFGIIHLVKRKQKTGMAVAGIVTAAVGILAFVIYWALMIHAAGRLGGTDDFLRRYEYQFDGEMKAPEDYNEFEDYLQHNYENF